MIRANKNSGKTIPAPDLLEAFLPLTPQEFLAVLNGEFSFADERRRIARLSRLRLAPPQDYERASWDFVRLVRTWTDMWLDTGVSTDGVEEPRRRTATSEVYEIVRTYLKSHPALALRSTRAPFEAIVPFRFSEPPPIDWDSAQTEVEQGPEGPIKVLVSGGATDNSLIAVEPAAQRLFVGMLFTEWAWNLAKCRNPSCGQYYILNKARRVYKRGTMCVRCNRIGSARRRVSQQRAEQSEERMRLAVDAMRQWNRMTDRQRRARANKVKEHLQRFVNAKSAHTAITVKWVTRNLAKIKQQAHSHRPTNALPGHEKEPD
jgi:hypothetical protein